MLRTSTPAIVGFPFFDRESASLHAIQGRFLDHVNSNQFAQSPFCIVGEPGIGKTRLVQELSRNEVILHKFPDGLLWVDAFETEASPHGDLIELRQEIALATLGRRMLVILDDVRNEAVVVATLHGIAGSNSGAIFNTRQPRIADAPFVGSFLQLVPLKEHEAYKFLATESETQPEHRYAYEMHLHNDPAALTGILKLCQGNIRSLEFAKKQLRLAHDEHGVEAWIGKAEEQDKLLPCFTGHGNGTSDHFVDVGLQVSEWGIGQPLHILAVFGPSPATFDDVAVASIWDVSEREARLKIRTLVAAGIIAVDEKERFFIRRVFHERLREKLDECEEHNLRTRILERHANHFCQRLRTDSRDYEQGGSVACDAYKRAKNDKAQIERAWLWASNNAAKNRTALRICCEMPRQTREFRSQINSKSVWDGWAKAAFESAQKLGDSDAMLGHAAEIALTLSDASLMDCILDDTDVSAECIKPELLVDRAQANYQAHDPLPSIRQVEDCIELPMVLNDPSRKLRMLMRLLDMHNASDNRNNEAIASIVEESRRIAEQLQHIPTLMQLDAIEARLIIDQENIRELCDHEWRKAQELLIRAIKHAERCDYVYLPRYRVDLGYCYSRNTKEVTAAEQDEQWNLAVELWDQAKAGSFDSGDPTGYFSAHFHLCTDAVRRKDKSLFASRVIELGQFIYAIASQRYELPHGRESLSSFLSHFCFFEHAQHVLELEDFTRFQASVAEYEREHANYSEAGELYDKVVASFRHLGRDDVAQVFELQLGHCLLESGENQEARLVLEHSLKCAEKCDSPSLEGHGCLLVADACRRLADHDQALAYYLRSEAILRQIKDDTCLLKAKRKLTFLHEEMGSLESAAISAVEQIRIAMQLGDVREEITAIRHLVSLVTELVNQAKEPEEEICEKEDETDETTVQVLRSIVDKVPAISEAEVNLLVGRVFWLSYNPYTGRLNRSYSWQLLMRGKVIESWGVAEEAHASVEGNSEDDAVLKMMDLCRTWKHTYEMIEQLHARTRNQFESYLPPDTVSHLLAIGREPSDSLSPFIFEVPMVARILEIHQAFLRNDLHKVRDLLASLDNSPELKWIKHILQGRLAIIDVQDMEDVERSQHINNAIADIESAIHEAVFAGMSLHIIDLGVLKARLLIHKEDLHGSEEELNAALFDTSSIGSEFGRVYAATEPECFYAWGEIDGRQVLAEVYLRRANRAFKEEDGDLVSLSLTRASEELERIQLLQDLVKDPLVEKTERLAKQLQLAKSNPSQLPIDFAEQPVRHSSIVDESKETRDSEEENMDSTADMSDMVEVPLSKLAATIKRVDDLEQLNSKVPALGEEEEGGSEQMTWVSSRVAANRLGIKLPQLRDRRRRGLKNSEVNPTYGLHDTFFFWRKSENSHPKYYFPLLNEYLQD